MSFWKKVKQTGGRQNLTLKEHALAEEIAEKVYNQIRSNAVDVNIIAKNTGMKEFQIKRIKDHLFFKEHELLHGRRSRFDPDPLIAECWKRLEAGRFSKHDIQLINHELFESKFGGIYKTDYITAHNAANRGGYVSPIENINTEKLSEIYRGFINRYK